MSPILYHTRRGWLAAVGSGLMLAAALPSLAHAQAKPAQGIPVTTTTTTTTAVVPAGELTDAKIAALIATPESRDLDYDREHGFGSRGFIEEKQDELVRYYSQYCERGLDGLYFAWEQAEDEYDRGFPERAYNHLFRAVASTAESVERGFTKLALYEALATADIVEKALAKPPGGHAIPLTDKFVIAGKKYQYLSSMVNFAEWTDENLDRPYWHREYRRGHRREFGSKMAEYARELLIHELNAAALYRPHASEDGSYHVLPSGGPTVGLEVIKNASKWAASGLAHTLIGEWYSCEIRDLYELSHWAGEAAAYDGFHEGLRDFEGLESWARSVAYSVTEEGCRYDGDEEPPFRHEDGDREDDGREGHRRHDDDRE